MFDDDLQTNMSLVPEGGSLSGLFVRASVDGMPVTASCYPLKSRERISLELVSLSPGDSQPEELIDRLLLLCGWFARVVDSVNEKTGEPERYVQLTLVLSDGTTVKFGSKGVVASLDVLCSHFGIGPWNPPLRVTLHASKAKRGRMYTLHLAPETLSS